MSDEKLIAELRRLIENLKFRKTEYRHEVLARLQTSSWMTDAGWSRLAIAAHYQANRDHRLAVMRSRGPRSRSIVSLLLVPALHALERKAAQ